MFKFLRKYNKWILAVGGTLLLIVFLIPTAITQLGNRAGRRGATWATVGLPQRHKVTSSDRDLVQRELRLLQAIQQNQGPLIPGLGEIDDPAHWFLLAREAEAAGLVGGAVAGSATAGIAQIVAVSGESSGFVGLTLAKVEGVLRLIDLYLDRNKLSDRRLRIEARRLFHGVDADVVVIEASTRDAPQAFGLDELRPQMEQFAEIAPGEGEMGFGYRLPDRLQLEWITIPADTVRDAIATSDLLGPVALRKHWHQNPLFGPVEPTAAVPDAVREDLLNTLTTRRLQEISKYANDQLRVERRGLNHRDGYYDIPQGWKDLDFQALTLKLQQEFAIPLPVYQAGGSTWLDRDELAALEGIGTAFTTKFGRDQVALPALAMAAREFGGTPTMPIQVGVSGPPLAGADQSVYLFRILAADPSRPPHDLDEVRERVVADLERLAHYRQLVSQTDAIQQMGIDQGLLAVALKHGTQVRRAATITLTDLSSLFSATTRGPESIRPSALPVIGSDETTVSAIIDRAMAIAPETPMSEVPEIDRTFVLPVVDKLALLVVRIQRQSPLTNELFASYAGFGIVQRPLLAESMGDDDELANVFGYDALAARYKFELTAGTATTQPEDG